MERDFLKHHSSEFTKAQILDKVFAPNDFDAVKGQNDLEALVWEEELRGYARFYTAASMGGSLFSLFNLTRMKQLSPTGKQAAVFGFLFFTSFAMIFSEKARQGCNKFAPVKENVKKE